MRIYLQKAIQELPFGEQDSKRSFVHHYTNLLPENLRNEGYEIKTSDFVGELGVPQIRVTAQRGNVSLGQVNALHTPQGELRITDAFIDPEHRSKGLGMALYEALLAHANKLGLKRILGGQHSTMAHRVHAKLAEKHGLSYEGAPAIGDTYRTVGEWERAKPEPYDGRFNSYNYTIKSEGSHALHIHLPPESTVKKTEKLFIPSRYWSKSEPNLYDNWDDYTEAAKMQENLWERIQAQLDGACRLAGLSKREIPLSYARQLFAEEEVDDTEALALQAYNIPVTDANRISLRTVIDTPEFGKAELPLAKPVSYKITPVTRESISVADAVQRAANKGYINSIKLNGKHSKGTMLAQDPQTKKTYLLKPGSGRNSPAKGVSETLATQSEREAAFWHVADAWGIGDAFPRADLILINNHQTAVMELLGIKFSNFGSKKREDPALPARILEPYRQNATLFKWSLIDYVLGNPDRHSQNMMVDPEERRIKLIDHGSALAGESFDPATDDNSFIPFYLRAWTNRKFKDMKTEERLRFMPGLDRRAEQLFDQWVADISDDKMVTILQDYHINPQPCYSRLSMVRAMPGPKWLVLNKMWSGAI